MRPPATGAVASTSSCGMSSAPRASICHHQRRAKTTTTPTLRNSISAFSTPPMRSFRSLESISGLFACSRDATLRPEARNGTNSLNLHRRRRYRPSASSSAAAAADDSTTSASASTSYFDSETFVASPPPPEAPTRPRYNRYRAAVDVDRSAIAAWEQVVPVAADPGWQPPPVNARTLAAFPLPWLRHKILPTQVKFVLAEIWVMLLVPLWGKVRRQWVTKFAPALDRLILSKKKKKKEASSPPVEIALRRWHGKQGPLVDVGEWILALFGR